MGMGGRGATKREVGWHVKFDPYDKYRGGGGTTKFWGSFYVVACCFSHIEGGLQKFPLKRAGGA